MAQSRPSGAMSSATTVVAGTLFGLGLGLSQMMDPAKVLAFLDLAGAWDPTLAAVMIGALAVTVPSFPVLLRRSSPALATAFSLPTKTAVDARLVGGSVVFGVGWGLAGLCPGPAVANLVTGNLSILVFVLGMVAGMALHRRFDGGPKA